MLTLNWDSAAICTFLSKTEGNLTEEYLTKLITKYDKEPSVSFAIGYYHHFGNEIDILCSLGKDFDFNKRWFNMLYSSLKTLVYVSLVVFVLLLSYDIYLELFLNSDLPSNSSQLALNSFLLLLISGTALNIVGNSDVKLFARKLKNIYLNQLEKILRKILIPFYLTWSKVIMVKYFHSFFYLSFPPSIFLMYS